MSSTDIKDDCVGAYCICCQKCPVDHQVGTGGHQRPVLEAGGFAFRAVYYQGGMAAGPLGDRLPFATDRESSAASTEDAGVLQLLDEIAAMARPWKRAKPSEVSRVAFRTGGDLGSGQKSRVRRQLHHVGSGAGRIAGPAAGRTLSLQATAARTLSTDAASMASIHKKVVSLPVPIPWTTAIGQQA